MTSLPPPDRATTYAPDRALVLAGVGVLVGSLLTMGDLDVHGPFLGALLVPSLAGAASCTWRPGRRTLLLTGLTTLLPLAGMLLVTGGGLLRNPLASHEFIAGVLALLGVLLALPAGVRAALRGPKAPSAPRVGAVYAMTLAGIALGASLVSGLSAAHVRESVDPAFDLAPDATVRLAVRDFEFVPARIALRAGDVTEIVVDNEDAALHTFTYENGGRTYSHELLPGSTTRFLVRFDRPGEAEVWCKPHASTTPSGTHDGMTALLIIEQGETHHGRP